MAWSRCATAAFRAASRSALALSAAAALASAVVRSWAMSAPHWSHAAATAAASAIDNNAGRGMLFAGRAAFHLTEILVKAGAEFFRQGSAGQPRCLPHIAGLADFFFVHASAEQCHRRVKRRASSATARRRAPRTAAAGIDPLRSQEQFNGLG